PTNNVPINKKAIIDMERTAIPPRSNTNPITRAYSFVTRLPILATSGDMIANAIKGKLVNKPTLQLDRPISSRIIPSNGPTEVISGRKLIGTSMITVNNNMRCHPLTFSYDNCSYTKQAHLKNNYQSNIA